MKVNQNRIIEEFLELVQIDSETKHEAKISAVLKEKFSDLGLIVKEDDSIEKTKHGANNLIATLEGTIKEAPTIYFTCHMDTVVPGNNIKPVIKDHYIYSDGTTILGADDKAGISALFEAIRVIKENEIEHGDVQFVITVGEESGLVGAKAIDTSLINASFGYALDSDGPVGEIVIAAPGQVQIQTKVYGKTAHAGLEPEKGISAITVAAKAIAELPLGRIDEETTANIGTIHGGEQTNIVCDLVELETEVRSINPQKLDEYVEKITKTIEDVAQNEGATVVQKVTKMYPGFHLTESDQVVQIAQTAAKNLNLPCKLVKSGGGSDANIFSGHGIKTANLAIGYEKIHTTEERIHQKYLKEATELVLEIIQEVSK